MFGWFNIDSIVYVYVWVKISLEEIKDFKKTTSPFDEQENMQKSSNLGKEEGLLRIPLTRPSWHHISEAQRSGLARASNVVFTWILDARVRDDLLYYVRVWFVKLQTSVEEEVFARLWTFRPLYEMIIKTVM